MVILIIILIKAFNNTLANVNVDTFIGLCLCSIAIEIFFVWMPLLNRNKWYKKMPYFKYLFKTLF